MAANGRPPEPILDVDGVMDQLAKHNGNVAAVARHYKVSRQAVQNFIRKNPAVKVVCVDARQGMLDNAESALYKAVLAGHGWAICFFLKTQGKERGYIENIDAKEFRQLQKTNAELLDHLKSLRAANASHQSPATVADLPTASGDPRGASAGDGLPQQAVPTA